MGVAASVPRLCCMVACLCMIQPLIGGEPDIAACSEPGSPRKDTNITIAERTDRESITLFAKLNHCTDVTLTVDASYENLKTRTRLPLTRFSDGKPSIKLITFAALDERLYTVLDYTIHWKYGLPGKTPATRPTITIPFQSGPYCITQGWQDPFSHGKGSGHECAIDWTMPEGTVVLAALPGRVTAFRADCESGGAESRYEDATNFVVIRHNDGTYASYSHLRKNGVSVQLGEVVRQGQAIGLSGATGFCTGPHLHFEIYNPIDGERIQSYPFMVRLADGSVVEPKAGQQHTGPQPLRQE